jgi:hypothetical protein
MQHPQQIQYLTQRYSRIQGLKGFPLGLLLFLVVLWVNFTSDASRNLALPIAFGLGSAVLYWLIDRYYRIHYGRVEGTLEQKRVDYFSDALAGLAGLAAFIIDISYDFPFSAVGLVFAAACVLEYLRLYRLGRSSYYWWQMVISFCLILTVSFLPLLGAKGLWLDFGMRSHLLLVLLATSIVLLVTSVWEHLNLVRQFPRKEA